MTKDTRRTLLFLLLLAVALLIYPGGLVLVKPWRFGLVLCDGVSYGETWVDRNGDAHRDPHEPPLERVCMWDAFRLQVLDEGEVSERCENSGTDETGRWDGGFKAGASCGGARCPSLLLSQL
jgi:hypothetical protein